MAQGAKGRSRQADPSGPSTNQTRSGHVKGTGGWSIVGTVETGFDPYSGELTNGQRSLVQNNGKALILQNANSNSSRSGQWDNSLIGNTGVKYRVDFMNLRGAGLVQWGGYDQGNGMTGLYQGQIGGDFDLSGGTLSLDGIGSYAQNAVNLSTFTGSCATLTKGPSRARPAAPPASRTSTTPRT